MSTKKFKWLAVEVEHGVADAAHEVVDKYDAADVVDTIGVSAS